MSADDVSAVEAASKKANKALRERYTRGCGAHGGTSTALATQQSEEKSNHRQRGTSGETRDRSGESEGEGEGTRARTGTLLGPDEESHTPSPAPRKQHSSSRGQSNASNKQQHQHHRRRGSSKNGGDSSAALRPSRAKNGSERDKGLIFARSLFDRLPRASALPQGYFKKHQLLGSGAFASTYLCEWVSEKEEMELEQQRQEREQEQLRVQQGSSGGISSYRNSVNRTGSAHRIQVSPRQSDFLGKNNNNNNSTAASLSAAAAAAAAASRVSPRNTASSDNINSSKNNDASGHDVNNNNNSNAKNSTAESKEHQRTVFDYSPLQLSSPYGQVSHLSSTRPFVTSTVDGTQIPRDRAFVCKFESSASVNKRLEGLGNPKNAGIVEENILANCAHPNIVAFIDKFQDADGNNVLVMEYVDGGDLKQELDRRCEHVNSSGTSVAAKHFSERSILFLLVQMTMAMEYLHRHNILHRDLKTPNILLSRKWLVKISDFGLAKIFDVDVDIDVSVSNAGTPWYLSPASWRRKPYSAKNDIWGLGVILYELITLRKPFDGETIKDLARAVCLDPPAPFNRSTISNELKTLCLRMLAKSEKNRPTAKEILRHPLMESAMQDFLDKFTIATASSTSSVDVSWNRLLQEQRKLVHSDDLSSSKSRRSQSKERSTQRHSVVVGSLYQKNLSRSPSKGDERSNGDDDDDNDSGDDDDDEKHGGHDNVSTEKYGRSNTSDCDREEKVGVVASK